MTNLWMDIKHADVITAQRRATVQRYQDALQPLHADGLIELPAISLAERGNTGPALGGAEVNTVTGLEAESNGGEE